jgi:hypothetical protein
MMKFPWDIIDMILDYADFDDIILYDDCCHICTEFGEKCSVCKKTVCRKCSDKINDRRMDTYGYYSFHKRCKCIICDDCTYELNFECGGHLPAKHRNCWEIVCPGEACKDKYVTVNDSYGDNVKVHKKCEQRYRDTYYLD